jgi:enediyne biosynthesis protein E4
MIGNFIKMSCLVAIAAAFGAVAEPVCWVDYAATWGLTAENTYGGRERKDFIVETTGNGVALFDADQDGDEDVLLLNGTTLSGPITGQPRNPVLYRNNGKGQLTELARLPVEGWAQGVCAGDYDNDGKTDLLITYFGQNRLFRNRGAGKFDDVSAPAGLPSTGVRFGSGCTFLDYDRDGRLDLFIANYVNLDLEKTPRPGKGEFCVWKEIPVMCGPRGLPLASNLLYHQEPDGTFRDVSAGAGILKPGGRYALQAVTADFDNDGWPDLYVACDMTPSLLYRNRGNGTFEERGVEAGVAFNADGRLQAGMGVAVGDFNNDGFLDIAKTNFSGDLTSLFLNEDGKFFTDVAGPARLGVRQLLGWGIAFLDADDDGWRDLLLVNGHVYPEVEKAAVGDAYRQPTLFFRNLGNGKFADLTATGGPGLAVDRPSRGLALGDLDGDGRPEAVILNMNDRPALLKNTAPGGRFLNLRLQGVKSNRSAIGARVTVEAGGRKWIDEVRSGESFYSQHSMTLHFGLADVRKVDRVTVRWPAGKTETWSNLATNARCNLTEGATAAGCQAY